jgi:glycosyltransferase involved in cell wall biosynthesis
MSHRARSGSYLVLNNFGETGIGLFGQSLGRRLRSQQADVEIVETQRRPLAFFVQFLTTIRTRQTLVANVGLTSWGSSPVLNLLGFFSIHVRSWIGRPTIVLLHNLIEVVDSRGAGYNIGPLTTLLAHWAVSGLRRAKIAVFSREMAETLITHYGIRVARCAPLPCEPPVVPAEHLSVLPDIVSFGYLSPYKGVDLLLEAQRSLRDECRLVIIGRGHALLSDESEYRRNLARIRRVAQEVHAVFLGFVPDAELISVLQRCWVGALPYSSTTGASASFTQLATAGVPVVASDLPEFQYLRDEGAGILLVPPSPLEIAAAIRSLLKDSGLRAKLSADQTAYASKHSWPNLCNWVLGGPQGPP